MLHYLGVIFIISGLIELTPLLVLPFKPQELWTVWSFIVPSALLILPGLAFRYLLKPDTTTPLNYQEGGIVVFISWSVACLMSALPFMIALGYPLAQAMFESVSGWTTTGLSVIDYTSMPDTFFFWRSVMQFGGGAGLAIIMLSALTGPVGTAITGAEGRELLVPHVKRTARLVMTIYSGYAVAGIIGYMLAGMTFFEAVNHSFAAISTGGFSTEAASIGYWDSFPIEVVSWILMILGNLNFVTAWTILRGKFKAFFGNGEIKIQLFLYPIAILLVFFFTTVHLFPTTGKALRVAVFEVVTAFTTTGFSTVGYNNWNAMGVHILILLMLIGAGICSTGGGIKQIRVYTLYKAVLWKLKSMLLPRRAVQVQQTWSADRLTDVTTDQIADTGVFVFFYMVLFFVGVTILSAYGSSIADSMFEFASALGTVGISVGVTKYTSPDAVLWTETIGMFLGRLEIFVVFASSYKMLRDSGVMATSLIGMLM